MKRFRIRKWGGLVAFATTVSLCGISPAAAGATSYDYTALDQSSMTAVAADSVETSGEGANGPIALVLDGNKDTYWHTKWVGGEDPLPHWFVIDLGAEVNNLGRVTLTPRQSSNGSGRVGDYEVQVSTDTQCSAASTVDAAEFTTVSDGSVEAKPASGKLADVNVTFTPTKARCVKVIYKSAWGGNDTSKQPGLLAEFGAATAVARETTDPVPGDGPQIEVPEGAPTITDGELTVRTHPDFPQVVDYQLGGKQIAGKYGDAISSVLVNGKATAVTVGTPTVSKDHASVTYPVTTALDGVGFDATMSVKNAVLSYQLTMKDPSRQVTTIQIPDLDLVSLTGKDTASQLMAATIQTSRAYDNNGNANANYKPGDTLIQVSGAEAKAATKAYMITAASSELAAGFETNAITGTDNNSRFVYKVKTDVAGQNVATISPDAWTYWASSVKKLADAGSANIGHDAEPMVKVKITADANADGAVTWQDGAIATRDILTVAVGRDEVKNNVIQRIPFNIVSQATHPFLRTLDDTKRISLETDNLGQQALLKGYQAEGHDSAQGDYANHYNERAGGLEDLKTLTEEGKKYNASFGIHVNATESYSEANCFSDGMNGYNSDKVAALCQISMPPSAAWGWMNQAYYMDRNLDLGSGNVLARLDQLREEFPADSNLNFLYWDVYYGSGWEAQRFASEMEKQGWRLGSEWAYGMPSYSTWSHWATDEPYGGVSTKGLNSQLIRFVENSYRDTFNPDPMLGNAGIQDFEGWTGHADHTAFIKNVWEHNLPTKFLQQSDIMSWTPAANGETGKVVFKNGTTVTSAVDHIAGYPTSPTNRTITYDGATVFKTDGSYLLPWKDGGTNRLYYWNPGNATATWKLTDAWSAQSSLTLFKLTDMGRVKVADVAVTNGTITLPATEDDTAYVLYPTSAVPAAVTPNWGEGTHIKDPGFFSGTLDSYRVTGSASVTKTDRQNYQAELAAGEAASISQDITLPAGDYSMWAWVEIQPGQTRDVTVAAMGDGITATNYQASPKAGTVATTIHSSAAVNATASDEKLGTYFQRVPVFFHTDGSPFTFEVAAAKGNATVDIDDLRVVAYRNMATKENPETVFYTDFEDTDTGYWPFVTGSTNAGGDARTQLAERHEPYSQSGWWGKVTGSGIEEGQKYLDNVLDGHWSLLAHQENQGLILRTAEGSIPLEANTTYRVTYDYQAAFNGDYAMILGHDEASGSAWKQVTDETWPIAQTRGTGWKDSSGTAGEGTKTFTKEFTVGENPTFLGITKSGSEDQGDLVIDNFRVEKLGILPTTSLTAEAQESEDSSHYQMLVTSTVSLPEGAAGNATNVQHAVSVPDGWTLTSATSGETIVKPGEKSVATWTLTIPKGAEPGDISFTGTWTFDGAEGSGTQTVHVDPANFPLANPIGGSDLTVVDVSSEQKSGEPAPNGPAAAAIDGDASTYWHTQWGPDLPYPHYIVLQPKAAAADENVTCTMTGIEYTARQGAMNGRVKGYEIYVSTDGANWGDPVATGELADVTTPQVIEFAQPAAGTYVKMVQTSSQNGKAYGGAAEIRLGGTCTSEAEPTDSPTDSPSVTPTDSPTGTPTDSPSAGPSGTATDKPSESPTTPGTSGGPSGSAGSGASASATPGGSAGTTAPGGSGSVTIKPSPTPSGEGLAHTGVNAAVLALVALSLLGTGLVVRARKDA